jgi:hypothetical protein
VAKKIEVGALIGDATWGTQYRVVATTTAGTLYARQWSEGQVIGPVEVLYPSMMELIVLEEECTPPAEEGP